ncbi:MAG: tRNA adenosine(34) deaminase TadA, partial [Myxococcota bacterium]|nr:tRNA adenosine(34) deaminase TadA [Myxococcota bacterium]
KFALHPMLKSITVAMVVEKANARCCIVQQRITRWVHGQRKRMSANQDELWMGEALKLAREASMMGEVPVGALVVFQGQIVGRGFNTRETAKSPLGHAEITAIERASKVLGRWRLWGATLYVTLEPCPMCAGAIVHARLPRVVFGASDPRTGACGSVFNLVQHEALNHRVDLTSGVRGSECSRLIKEFFAQLRRR